jgi:hypothetical protein
VTSATTNIFPGLDERVKRMEDLRPYHDWAHRFLMDVKEQEFRRGVGPSGPHRPLKPSTRRRHRTGVPLWNTKDLGRSYYQAGHRHHVWREMEGGFVFGSSHPVHRFLEAKGYDLEGLSDDTWRALDDALWQWLETGELPRGGAR